MTESYRQTLIKELKYQYDYKDVTKDILIVFRNQFNCLQECLNSLSKNTSNYNLYLWDNGSLEYISNYAKTFTKNYFRSNDNIGYIKSNNKLFAESSSEYVILLNSDTIVQKHWDESLIGFLQNNLEYAAVGYQGGILDDSGLGTKVAYGEEIDYIVGWCVCLRRSILNNLFDEENLKFAYCEDADLSLRLKENGYKIYALHLDYVKHKGGLTTKEVIKENTELENIFKKNSEYIKTRWIKRHD